MKRAYLLFQLSISEQAIKKIHLEKYSSIAINKNTDPYTISVDVEYQNLCRPVQVKLRNVNKTLIEDDMLSSFKIEEDRISTNDSEEVHEYKNIVQQKTDSEHFCPLCGKFFQTKTRLKYHKAYQHKKNEALEGVTTLKAGKRVVFYILIINRKFIYWKFICNLLRDVSLVSSSGNE